MSLFLPVFSSIRPAYAPSRVDIHRCAEFEKVMQRHNNNNQRSEPSDSGLLTGAAPYSQTNDYRLKSDSTSGQLNFVSHYWHKHRRGGQTMDINMDIHCIITSADKLCASTEGVAKSTTFR